MGFVVDGLAPSRASPLPHLIAFPRTNPVECGSWLAREGVRKNTANLWVKPPENESETPPRPSANPPASTSRCSSR
ncbi:hypothetical protein EAH78_10045 [Pseudomonas arsenicoxydans]|uniref:Uncharacterized protein n=1 Tax=Pseudomonas arsenicoxydans TaxID=702115 RepID=A0A502HYK0_9PSED|nr:hypothetical protein EAH78_10045 [Pseudomonas arsenicoxydans]